MGRSVALYASGTDGAGEDILRPSVRNYRRRMERTLLELRGWSFVWVDYQRPGGWWRVHTPADYVAGPFRSLDAAITYAHDVCAVATGRHR